jgi:hypothetical protein
LTLSLSAGVTKLGFISDKAIASSGWQSTITFGRPTKFSYKQSLRTWNFEGDGFALDLPHEQSLSLAAGEKERTVVVAGTLNVSVPTGYTNTCLEGQHGRVTEGAVEIVSPPGWRGYLISGISGD